MTKLVLATLLLLAAVSAQADTICSTYGSVTFCNDTRSTQTATCIQIGNQVYCN